MKSPHPHSWGEKIGMKNIVGETPMDPLHARLLFSTRFVSDTDIEDKTILDLGCGFG